MERAVFAILIFGLGGSGCGGVPAGELVNSKALEVRIRGHSTRAFHPGQGGRFYLVVKNLSGKEVRFDGLEVSLEAVEVSRDGQPSPGNISQRWKYAGLQAALPPGKTLDFQVLPEPQEFPLGSLSPGRYQVRATVNGRFTSAPHAVVVEPLKSLSR